MTDAFDNLSPELKERLDRCRAAIVEVGIVLRGSLIERYMPCGKKGCRCQATPPALHGPYCQWTTKADGKTKTVRLSREEAAAYKAWIANGRRLNQLLAEWEAIGFKAAQEIRGKSHA